MAIHRNDFPQLDGGLYVASTGMETDLIFNQGVDLPGFASYPLLESKAGRAQLNGYYRDMIAVGKEHGIGVILESPTWVANRDRGATIGYSPEQLVDLNKQAIAHMSEARDTFGDLPTLISANVGPRADAYAPSEQMSAEEAETYHTEQIAALAETEVDVISGYTLAYPAEAVGIVRAAKRFGLPVIIAFTVETDGHLPTGASLKEAITQVDAEADGYAAYFMINCAHPDHFENVLSDDPWMQRLRGIVANASRCSHAQLDEAEELDDGDPVELGQQLAEIRRRFPQISVLGGCCGTDMRHMSSIARSAKIAEADLRCATENR
ncbi:homocysteine S-methyltransferase family protein [Sulfitobacter sp. SK011]|uniref:homocysteine S-methyltransferase family protein n=1 Tax=Sulfitobacter sp. SK011 TaxID=1389004 RepID=UPI000E0B962B|nr:homocysteine S-methyltransferase family protein [Sulfitobacter sp. SK011]AXI44018.1 homocysteine S-methyltransferase [Sulfitobacter sp. SK011]